VIALRTESVRKLYRETAAEMKKINWPDQQTTKSLTILVIGISVVLGILLGGIDYLLLKLLQAL
jgi:preprotein translocase subunit SecE